MGHLDRGKHFQSRPPRNSTPHAELVTYTGSEVVSRPQYENGDSFPGATAKTDKNTVGLYRCGIAVELEPVTSPADSQRTKVVSRSENPRSL